jgi:polar amino acid transport system substrate-binding protein
VKIEIVPVSHETKVPILATGEADISIAPLSVTPKRSEVVDFIVYSTSSLCFFGLADNPKIKDLKSVDDLNSPDLTMAYFGAAETRAPGFQNSSQGCCRLRRQYLVEKSWPSVPMWHH